MAQQKGVGLIEVMVGVLIFIGGISAVAGMQTKSLQATHDTIQRSQAFWMVNTVAELIRLNPEGLDSSTYQTKALEASTDLSSYCQGFPVQCIGASCSSDQMAAFDIHNLMCSNVDNLIEPLINIECGASCNRGAPVVITISWRSRAAEQGVLATRQKVEFRYNRN